MQRHGSSLISAACPSCRQPGRPKLGNVQALADEYQCLEVCLPEGEGLLHFLDQANLWQGSVDQLMASDELTAALKILGNAKNDTGDNSRSSESSGHSSPVSEHTYSVFPGW